MESAVGHSADVWSDDGPEAPVLASASGAFGIVRLNTTSAVKTIALHNGGGGPLDLATMAVAGADAAQFSITGGTSDPAQACTVTVT